MANSSSKIKVILILVAFFIPARHQQGFFCKCVVPVNAVRHIQRSNKRFYRLLR